MGKFSQALATIRKHLAEKCQPRADPCESSEKENKTETRSAGQSQSSPSPILGDSSPYPPTPNVPSG